MGAAVSAARRARRGVTSTILAPFKRRGYYLTAAEVRARNPTYYDKMVSDDYLFEPEALARLRRNHKDAFRRLRKRLVDTIPDTLARARYMERYRARHPFRPSARVADPKISFAPVGATRVPGTNATHRFAPLDLVAPGAVPDQREIALGRGPRSRDGDAFPRDGDAFGDASRPPSADASRPPSSDVPRALSRRRLDASGAPTAYDDQSGKTRWRAYVREEERKITEFAAEEASRREAHDRMMRRHYRRAYGRFGREYVPPPVPAWMLDDTTLRERAPWRRGRAAAANVREAVEGFDEDLKMRTLRWWGAVDLRRTAVETENARRIAARGRWGREGGDGALASGAGFIGGSKPTGHAAGFDVSLAKIDGDGDGDGGWRRAFGAGIDAGTVSDALRADRARNRRARLHREAVAAENLARREAAAAEMERLAREQRAAEEAARLAKRAKKFGQ